MAQKVQFIVTVLHKPKLLIFDEPFSGFDPINANLLKEEILSLHRDGATVIFSTHNMASVEALCNEITLINDSHNILSGNVNEIRNSLGGNRMSMDLTNVSLELPLALQQLTADINISQLDNGMSRILVTPGEGVTRRELIECINTNADIMSIEPAIPSMEEIFITTVQQYNKLHNNEK